MLASYDTIGANYAALRKPDPGIAVQIVQALGSARTVPNVGAGTGFYEPADRDVTAVEPSLQMIRQRPPTAAKAIHGRAEDLPFEDASFDASMAILTVHHWADKERGFKEMRRVTRGPVVLLTFDPAHVGNWLADYLPELVALDEAQMPRLSDYEKWLGPMNSRPLHIPHDCTDGFLYAYWRRPGAYLDKRIRSGSSSFWAIRHAEEGLRRLAIDLENGEWERRHGHLLALEEYDAGYRLLSTIEPG